MLNLDFADFPILKTDRLILRNVLGKDFELLHKLHSDPVVNAFVGRKNTSTLKKAQAYILRMDELVKKKEGLYWVITLRNSDDLIGAACCWNFDTENGIVEVGYELLPEYQSRGIMTEALNSVIGFTFNEMKASLITAFPSSDNSSSVTLLKKLNFVFEDKPYNNKHQNIENIVTYTLRP
ncbi:GNAT family N-acetyltransferase [Pontibacter cellulosilyticus]|uniref:GNAT family N-acetyltransferase n=1 Tax=Pontibacter cellulosilyticus TaxID=1720253 RepID=A0A923NA62_9BACT|nr:GNAT family N-acetyltransferase [Pontibacter cellulosilyticus]MBC5994499.1 GNAT family N-acetyltransferase [Pontibacter cellulosilyticus]